MAKGNGGTRTISANNASSSRTNSASAKSKASQKIPLNAISVDDTAAKKLTIRNGYRFGGAATYSFQVGNNKDNQLMIYANSYSEAKKKAKKEAQKRGEWSIKLMY